ncbi:MAG: hypothetical protein GYB65_07570 [Chloroflexi bacterium]|nr:hypothetical protein [Chloroflexota bacterium]
MTSKTRIIVGAILAVSVLVAGLVIGIVLAAPSEQRAQLPTPTPHPVDNLEYTLTEVGGQMETLTYDYPDQDGFVLGSMAVTSQYPRGMVFSFNPQSPNGAIQDVILFMRFPGGAGTRFVAEWDEAAGAWIAHPWPNGDSQPAWTPIEFYWRVRDETGVSVDTPTYTVDYSDPTRAWYRLETPYYLVYWFGMSDDDPDRFARSAALAVASTRPRRIEGFGEPLSFLPVGVIYGSRAAWSEIESSGITDDTAGGYTDTGLGMTIQYVPGGSTNFQIGWLSHVLTHELTHLYQFDVLGGASGPTWWREGQAEWFGYDPGAYDDRMMNLATLQDLPTMSREISRNLEQADGRPYLVYDMGASFVNWYISTYSIEAHAVAVELMQGGTTFYAALEAASGDSFFDMENAWRAYIGLEPFDLADIDPAAALEPIPDPQYAVGDVVTLPASPPLPAVYTEPGPTSPTSGQCFANMDVTVLASGRLDGADFYQVDCMGQVGWMPVELLAGQ